MHFVDEGDGTYSDSDSPTETDVKLAARSLRVFVSSTNSVCVVYDYGVKHDYDVSYF